MWNLVAEHIVTLIFGLISAGAIAYCRRLNKNFNKKIQEYTRLMDEEKEEKLQEMISNTIQPLKDELAIDRAKFEAIKDSYRYRLISLCEIYLERGYLSSKEYSSLSEMWKVYHGLGGNSQGEDYYHKVEKLPVHE